MKHLFPFPFAALLLLCAACARQGTPTGGPKDIAPPKVDSLRSTPNFATNFTQRRIELQFDEWITLSDAANQVVVSPPLAKRPSVKLKGKKVVLEFEEDEVLRPQTTYTINFGTAVKDFHEGNAAKDLRFVFSTGDFIDSLSFRGSVADAFSGEPAGDISVMLYSEFTDTTLRKSRPYYFTRTDKNGQFLFQNLREGSYQVAAVEDTDQNLRWDGENEHVAFRDSLLLLNDSLHNMVVNLKVFKNRSKFRLVGINMSRYGLVRASFSAPADSFSLKTLAPENLLTLTEKSPDSLLFWYDLPAADSAWTLIFFPPAMKNLDGKLPQNDTIPVRKLARSDFLKNHRIAFGDEAAPLAGPRNRSANTAAPQAVKTVSQAFTSPASLRFNCPIVAYDTSLWVLMRDSSRLTAFDVLPDSSSPRQLQFRTSWAQGKNYKLTLLPGALRDFWGTANADTLRRNFNVPSEKQLGALSILLEGLKPGTNYVFQLLNGATSTEERRFLAEKETEKLVFLHLTVGAYTVRLIEDTNGNGRWDSGDVGAWRQPEPIFSKKLDPLRANWEVEATLNTSPAARLEKKPKQ